MKCCFFSFWLSYLNRPHICLYPPKSIVLKIVELRIRWPSKCAFEEILLSYLTGKQLYLSSISDIWLPILATLHVFCLLEMRLSKCPWQSLSPSYPLSPPLQSCAFGLDSSGAKLMVWCNSR